ncbi:MAG: hypothetical protein IAE77_07395 [Prosthecobacter sp.]|jgi:hypothetical protein|uniref:hypothetical protein n=1 Tax=Prosthecobacter sp. TaxID=1965333 RepID=UPI0019EF4325|nr:hypothetical protein [Prosthecobacter sp.]MBE2283270.1 hypothetical protein [Prosthecobacter sp.]
MRWLALFSLLAASLTAHGEPLPKIRVGGSGRTVKISMTPWYSGFISTSQAFLTGTVIEISSDVQVSPQQTWLSESCTVRVEHAFGRMTQIEGIATAKLTAGYESSPYEPVDPQWGRLRHLQKGRHVLVLLHEYEGDPCFGADALIEFDQQIQDLPRILRRTGFNPALFTRSDLAVVKSASPLLYEQLAVEAEVRGEIENDTATELNELVAGCVGGVLLLLLVADLVRRSTR